MSKFYPKQCILCQTSQFQDFYLDWIDLFWQLIRFFAVINLNGDIIDRNPNI